MSGEPGAVQHVCGPLPFRLGMREALLDTDLAADDIHYEVFGPDSWAAAPV